MSFHELWLRANARVDLRVPQRRRVCVRACVRVCVCVCVCARACVWLCVLARFCLLVFESTCVRSCDCKRLMSFNVIQNDLSLSQSIRISSTLSGGAIVLDFDPVSSSRCVTAGVEMFMLK